MARRIPSPNFCSVVRSAECRPKRAPHEDKLKDYYVLIKAWHFKHNFVKEVGDIGYSQLFHHGVEQNAGNIKLANELRLVK